MKKSCVIDKRRREREFDHSSIDASKERRRKDSQFISIVVIQSSSILRLLLCNFKSSPIAKSTLIRLRIVTKKVMSNCHWIPNKLNPSSFSPQIFICTIHHNPMKKKKKTWSNLITVKIQNSSCSTEKEKHQLTNQVTSWKRNAIGDSSRDPDRWFDEHSEMKESRMMRMKIPILLLWLLCHRKVDYQ